MKRFIRIVALCSAFLLSVPVVLAQNDNEVTFGNYTVNYNTFPSTFLEPDISKAVGIWRSDGRAVITIAVREAGMGTEVKSVKAAVSGQASNLIGQIRKLKFSEVRDGDVLYYIGEYTVAKNEKLTFDITVQPADATQQHEFQFTRQF